MSINQNPKIRREENLKELEVCHSAQKNESTFLILKWIRAVRIHLNNQAGQSIFLVGILISSFLLFFGFVVNTGVLITAKISLQTAADAAAYAGAATQARILDHISLLNYDMRQQYKKFLLRYYVVGNLGNPKFPNPSQAGATDYDFWKYYKTTIPTALGNPVICLPVALSNQGTQSGSCAFLSLQDPTSNIRKVGGSGSNFSEILKAAIRFAQENAAAIQNACVGQGQLNFFIMLAWVFRGDADKASLEPLLNLALKGKNIPPDQKSQLLSFLNAITKGTGVLPRNLTSALRAKTLVEILNQKSMTEVNLEKIQSIESSVDADLRESTIMAFRSAISNLNNSVMPHSGLVFSELHNNRTTLIRKTTQFEVYFQDYDENKGTNGDQLCEVIIKRFPITMLPYALELERAIPVHYAVKLTAKAKLMFLPGEPIELSAMAAARPFGSRIGPSLTSDDVSRPFTGNPSFLPNVCPEIGECRTPNLELDKGIRFQNANFLRTLLNTGQITQAGGYNIDNFNRMLKHALLPTPLEIGKYNILPPQTKDAMELANDHGTHRFPTEQGIYRFYAPLTLASQETPEGLAREVVQQFRTTQVQNTTAGVTLAALDTEISNSLKDYFPKLKSGIDTENGETLTFAAVELPIQPNFSYSQSPFWITDPKRILTSWGPPNARGTPVARLGYSVKFVPFESLLKAGAGDVDTDMGKVDH